MKTFKKLFNVALLSTTILLTNPLMAQTGDNTTNTEMNADHDDSGKWGLLGLIGLAGLLGLRKKDDERHRTTTNR